MSCLPVSKLQGYGAYKQFGYALASLDYDKVSCWTRIYFYLNFSKDGVSDLFVSAPFSNDADESGSVFIFNGVHQLGLSSEFSQEIKATKTKDRFGFSLSAELHSIAIGSPGKLLLSKITHLYLKTEKNSWPIVVTTE